MQTSVEEIGSDIEEKKYQSFKNYCSKSASQKLSSWTTINDK